MSTTHGKQLRITPAIWERIKKEGEFGEPLYKALERIIERLDNLDNIATEAIGCIRAGDNPYYLIALFEEAKKR